MVPSGMTRVPWPFLVHQATSSPSVSAMVELGFCGAQMHQSARAAGQRRRTRTCTARERRRRGRTIDVVDERGLAERVRALGGGVALVVALLGAADELGVRVRLVRLSSQPNTRTHKHRTRHVSSLSRHARTRGSAVLTMPDGYA